MNKADLEYLIKLVQTRSVADLQGRAIYDKLVKMYKEEVENEKNISIVDN